MVLTDGHTAAPSVLTPAGTDAVLGDATAMSVRSPIGP